MKKFYSALIAGVFMAGLCCSCATTDQQSTNADKPGGIVADVAVYRATVYAINYEARTMVVKDAQGNSHTIKAGPEVVNFPQIKVGDEIIAEASQSIAIFVDKPEAKPAASASLSGEVMLAPLGAKPGMVASKTIEITATVQNINYNTRTVTLMKPDGTITTTKVDPRVKKFDNIKTGDQVYMQLTEEIAIRVQTQN